MYPHLLVFIVCGNSAKKPKPKASNLTVNRETTSTCNQEQEGGMRVFAFSADTPLFKGFNLGAGS